jgi:spermidine/putrescine transport system ATP-binding protein
MSESLVEFRNVSKHFDDYTAVDNLNLSIEQGEFIALMGSSGCGKTTSLRMLAGFEEPSEGEVLLRGKCINHLKSYQRNTPLVWQTLALFPFLSVVENVEFGLRMQKVAKPERRKRALKWLDNLAIAEFAERRVDQLSGGQRQRVALARTLVTEPEILLLDEPLSALDSNMVVHMQGVLTELQRELGITFIYVTHSQSEAFAMADRVVIMNEGRVQQIGSPKDLYQRPNNHFVAGFVGKNNILGGQYKSEHNGIWVLAGNDGDYKIKASEGEPADRSAATDFAISADRVFVSRTVNSDFDNQFMCRLKGEEFVGSAVVLYLETESGEKIISLVNQAHMEVLGDLKRGDYYAHWQSDHCHIIKP